MIKILRFLGLEKRQIQVCREETIVSFLKKKQINARITPGFFYDLQHQPLHLLLNQRKALTLLIVWRVSSRDNEAVKQNIIRQGGLQQ